MNTIEIIAKNLHYHGICSMMPLQEYADIHYMTLDMVYEKFLAYGRQENLFNGVKKYDSGVIVVVLQPRCDQPPKYLTLDNGKRVLHCTTGPAVQYGNDVTGTIGKRVFSMWGVEFLGTDIKFVTTPPDQIVIADVLNLVPRNVEQGQAVIRKIGMQRLLHHLSPQILDTKSITRRFLQESSGINENPVLAQLGTPYLESEKWAEKTRTDIYTLYTLDATMGHGERPDIQVYLHMINPSEHDDVLEPVHPDCTSVNDALSFRNTGKIISGYVPPEILT